MHGWFLLFWLSNEIIYTSLQTFYWLSHMPFFQITKWLETCFSDMIASLCRPKESYFSGNWDHKAKSSLVRLYPFWHQALYLSVYGLQFYYAFTFASWTYKHLKDIFNYSEASLGICSISVVLCSEFPVWYNQFSPKKST